MILSIMHKKTAPATVTMTHAPSKGSSTSKGGPTACSQTQPMHPVGTIVCKTHNSESSKGAVTGCDSNGDSEEMTCDEVKQHFKPWQKHSQTSQETLLEATMCAKKLKQTPTAIQKQHQLGKCADQRGFVCARIDMAWCRLKKSGRPAGDAIRAHLATFGCHESKFTPGFFTHASHPISSTVVADDFRIKHKDAADFQHLQECLSL